MLKNIITLLLVSLLFLGILSCGGPGREESQVKSNSPPVIVSAKVLPENPSGESDLVVAIESKDTEQDPITYRYQWIKNDSEMVGENRPTLKRGTFKKGDILRVRVVPSDGKEEGRPFLSASVIILNAPPIIQEVRIEPKIASSSEDLKVVIKANDPDGDFIYFTYQWEVNGEVLNEEVKEQLPRIRFKKGDSVIVTVTPDDREASGTSKKSERVIISNSPPMILSSPPTSVEKTTYLYQVRANDPDNDPLTFLLKSAPKGMKIDKNTGLIQWEIRKEDKGAHQIEIEVSDNEGAKAIQRYLLTVDFRPPG